MRLTRTQTSAVSKHPNETAHYPLWDKVKFIGRPFTFTSPIHHQQGKHNWISETWMPTIKQHNSWSVLQRISRIQRQIRTMRIGMHQSQTTKVLLILIHCQLTPSPDEDKQHSGRNVAIHIKVTKSWDRLTEPSSIPVFISYWATFDWSTVCYHYLVKYF